MRALFRLIPVGLSALLITSVSVGSANAAPPDYLSDPEFQSLAASASYTRGLAFSWGNLTEKSMTTEKEGGYKVTSETEIGYNAPNGEYGVKFVMEESGGGVIPQNLPLGHVNEEVRAIIDKQRAVGQSVPIPPPSFSYVDWFGSNYNVGDFVDLDRQNLTDVERKALKMLGVPRAEFLVGFDPTPSNPASTPAAVFDIASIVSPAGLLSDISYGAKYSDLAIGNITAAAGEEGSTVYTVPTSLPGAQPEDMDFFFTVNADGVLVKAHSSWETDILSGSFERELVSWDIDAPTLAQPSPDAVVVDRYLYWDTVYYLYDVDNMKMTARYIADSANAAAEVTDTKVTPGLIQRLAKRDADYANLTLRNTKRGVTMGLAEAPWGVQCQVNAVKSKGEWKAVSRCSTPKTPGEDIVPPQPVLPKQ